jgi:putative DNA methylase
MDTLLPVAGSRLIEKGFPCHQVGAETQRERGASSALPPLYFLHVWWARRPLTPSRAAILASVSPPDLDPDTFLRQLGIEQRVADIRGDAWVLTGKILGRVRRDQDGSEKLPVDDAVLHCFENEQARRAKCRAIAANVRCADAAFASDPVLTQWEHDSRPLPDHCLREGTDLVVELRSGDPALVAQRIEFAKSKPVTAALGRVLKWDAEDLYAYERAFAGSADGQPNELVVLDPTAGGGSIPFEALRLGYRVIANELNPVAVSILHATVDYPARFGKALVDDIREWGERLVRKVEDETAAFVAFCDLPDTERDYLRRMLRNCPELLPAFDVPEHDHVGQLFLRQVTCPTCGGEAPLLNSCWLAKNDAEPWAVRVITDGRKRGGKARFETYRVVNGRGPGGEDPNFATVGDGVGTCVHCRHAIPEDEVKVQAQGRSEHGRWTDRLYCIAAVRFEPKLDKNGNPERYKSGERRGEVKTRRVRFFRPPNERDLDALAQAERCLAEKWPEWEAAGLIPTEQIPGDSNYNRGHRLYGMTRWCDMFTPRQLLGHLTLVEELRRLTPEIIAGLGAERGRAVITYLQFAIDKGVDYNSKFTRWEYTRGVVKGTFGRHDFSLKWTFGEMIFTGPSSGAAWALDQVVDAYRGIAELAEPIHERVAAGAELPVEILQGTAAHLGSVADNSVDLVCIDPPYYNNVQYGELSDFYYVWQRRTLRYLYPEVYARRLVNRRDEAVANPARDGSAEAAARTYERMMGEIFAECRRVLKPYGLMTVMFTHVSQEAWEALTRSLIESGWTITSTVPVESEGEHSIHQMNQAAAASSIFLSCRKRTGHAAVAAAWTGIGGTGVQQRIRRAVEEGLQDFAGLRLNPVDEMVACYGRALQVLSEQWPVLDGDDRVSPLRAMNEASSVVAANQIARLTKGRIAVSELDGETRMALTMFGIFGLAEFAWDEALNLSRSLGIGLHAAAGGYEVERGHIGVNTDAGGRARRARGAEAEAQGYAAPLVRRGSKLRLARPEERDPRRLTTPQSDWDRLQGLIMEFRRGDAPVARAYLGRTAADREDRILDLVEVWAVELVDPELKREAELIRFGLRPAAA